ncbi:hypothetical protein DL770_000023 [Monosporascus sp. CRB-9-2]|nr:hypothetical protein DL770_000023 [Monosporascus sp. CRB-9-2]
MRKDLQMSHSLYGRWLSEENAENFKSLPADPAQYAPTEKKPHPSLLQDVRWAGHKQRQKVANLARASKCPPYGYGPATGGRLVVEKVAEVDEGEEDYGEYQAYRGEEVKDESNLDFWNWVKAGEKKDAARDAEVSADTAGPMSDILRVAEPKGRKCAELDALFERETNARKYETTVVDSSPVADEKVLEDD